MGETLILTLQLDARVQAFYEELRKRHFPPERNLIPAHLTLFHQLADDSFTRTTVLTAANATSEFVLNTATARSIGGGVAVFFTSEALARLQKELAMSFGPLLIPQDRQRFQPHIVVQNKVKPALARETLTEVQQLTLAEPRAVGLTLWRYRGGPWEHARDFPFRDGR